jgi:GAF domain
MAKTSFGLDDTERKTNEELLEDDGTFDLASGILSRASGEDAPPRSARGEISLPPEELVVELFERFHELHFLPALADGLRFAAEEISRFTASGVVFVHVFDLDKNQFVLVSARGKNAGSLELTRTSGKDPLFVGVLRRAEIATFPNFRAEPRFDAERFAEAGVHRGPALVGPILEAGRYLGVIEVAAPDSGRYTNTEIHALDYMTTQLAKYLSSRPIVLDADVLRAAEG